MEKSFNPKSWFFYQTFMAQWKYYSAQGAELSKTADDFFSPGILYSNFWHHEWYPTGEDPLSKAQLD